MQKTGGWWDSGKVRPQEIGSSVYGGPMDTLPSSRRLEIPKTNVVSFTFISSEGVGIPYTRLWGSSTDLGSYHNLN